MTAGPDESDKEDSEGVKDKEECKLESGVSVLSPGQLELRLKNSGWLSQESKVLALGVDATLSSPARGVDAVRLAEGVAVIGDLDLALDMAGVVFAFNTVNRVADARRVELEYASLRRLPLIQGWVERRFAYLTGLAYDLSYRHRTGTEPGRLLDQLGDLFIRRGAPGAPPMFHRLKAVPHVLEGIFEMIDACDRTHGIRDDFWLEAVGMAVASRAMAGSCLREAIDNWLNQASLLESQPLLEFTLLHANCVPRDLADLCRQFCWRIANEAHKVTGKEIERLRSFGLTDGELLDLTLAVSVYAALSIVEPLIVPTQSETDRST